MSQHAFFKRRVLYVASLCAFGFVGTVYADAASQPTVGSSNTITADPGVPRPAGTPCVVQLLNGESYADGSSHPFNYAPPAGCQGSWSKVVLEADFSISGDVQFDRVAHLSIGDVNLFYGTTPRSSASLTPNWHVERDVTDYTALLKSANQGQSAVDTLVNGAGSGVVQGSARLLFYPGKPVATTPSAVYAVGSDSIGTGLSKSLSLPRNVEKAYLDVLAQGKNPSVLWFACAPTDLAGQVQACTGGNFRETEISIDGQPAGVAPVYPAISTGAADPALWQPTPGVQALNLLPYRVDLTPFAGVLSDGQAHTVSVNVAGASNTFASTATLLVYQDSKVQQVTGSITRNTLVGQPATTTSSNTLQTDASGNLTGAIHTSLNRQFVIEGVANTSEGRVLSTVTHTVSFNNTQDYAIAGDGTASSQNVDQTATVDSVSQSKIGPVITAQYREAVSYPIHLDSSILVADDGSVDVANQIEQDYQKHLNHSLVGITLFSADVSNTVKSQNTQVFGADGSTSNSGQQSSQVFAYTDSLLGCYKASLNTSAGTLARFTTGKGCVGGFNRVAAFAHPDGSPDGGNANLLW